MRGVNKSPTMWKSSDRAEGAAEMKVGVEEPRLDTSGASTLFRTRGAPHRTTPMVVHGGQPSPFPPSGLQGATSVGHVAPNILQ